MEASWHQNRSKIDVNIEKRFFLKTMFFLRKNKYFEGSGGRSWSINLSKIDQKRRLTWEGISASIFDRFWWIFGAKLGGKMEPKSIQKGIEKTMQKRRAHGCAKKSHRSPITPRDPAAQTPGKGVGGRGKPLPEGRGVEKSIPP